MQKRLQKLCDLAQGDICADIGCDHGYVCEMLIDKKVKQIYACEVTQKNLDKAKNNISNYVDKHCKNIEYRDNGISYEGGQIDFVLSDGFKNLQFPVECGIIAGMGGELILNILLHDESKLPKYLVLQPNSKVEIVRRTLANYYEFVEDKILYDCGKFYNIMKLIRGKDNLSDLEISFGRTNLLELHEDFKAYINDLKARISGINNSKFDLLKRQIEKVEGMYE